MTQGKTQQARLYVDDKAEIELLIALLKLETGEDHTIGDVVRTAKLALYAQRPDLAERVQAVPAQVGA
jgi:hypothetical protein